MAEHATVVRIARLLPKPDSGEQVQSLAEEIAIRAREVQGCFGAQVCRLKERPGELALISRWESEQALASALASADYRKALSELEGLVGEAIETESYISV